MNDAVAVPIPAVYPVPGVHGAAPVNLMASHFALQLVATLGPKFNLRRDVNNVLTATGQHLFWPASILARFQQYLANRCKDYEQWKGAGTLSAADFLARHANWNGLYDDGSIFYYVDEYVKHHPKDVLAVFRTSAEELALRLQKSRTLLETNIDLLGNVLSLERAERRLLLFGALIRVQRDLRAVLVDCKVPNGQEAYQILAAVAGCDRGEIAQALKPGGRLETLSLFESVLPESSITDLGDVMRVPEKLMPVLLAEYKSESDMMAAFTRPARPTELSFDDYPHLGSDARYLTALLQTAAGDREAGVNILIYGPPGTGKTELAKLVAKEAGCELYEVECLDKDGNSLSGRERYRSLQVSQAFLKGRPSMTLLFDEVEDVFPAAGKELEESMARPETKSVAGKAWVNQTLETNPVPVIWISNSIKSIDPAYLRRFQFHLEVRNPPQSVRESITRKHLAGMDVDEAFITSLAARRTLTPAQIQSAARFARLTHASLGEPVPNLILRQLEHSDRALGHGAQADEFRPCLTTYDLSLLNVETRFPIARIIASLAQRQRGTLCFYGPPGTGKTALGEHIARSIERPLLVKRASDLLSKFVGETEERMAKMFEEAKRERAVLLLDEADTYLQSRQNAQRSWEISEVNEMLQQMERFEGVFICTTNLFDRLDEAALRRFNFKIRFMPLGEAQRERMFAVEALGGDAAALTGEQRNRLKQLRLLTPGDFAVVKRQADLFDAAIPPEDFLAQLEIEHKQKPDVRAERAMGFLT